MEQVLPVTFALLIGLILGGVIVGVSLYFVLGRRAVAPSAAPLPPLRENIPPMPLPPPLPSQQGTVLPIGAEDGPTSLEPPGMVERDYQLPVLPANFDSLLMSRPLEGSLPWFEGVGGLIAGQRIVLRREETVIGRSQVCDVQFPDPKVSRQHAMVRLYRGRYFIQDMHSSRGTLVNSQPIKTHLLQDGDHVRIGDTVLIFHMPPRDPDQALEGEIVAQDS